jgi:hypothetical protein
VGFLISMSGINVFYHISLQVFFWGLVGLGLCLGAHVAGRRSGFLTIWRFGNERPIVGRSARRDAAGAAAGSVGLGPTHETSLAD